MCRPDGRVRQRSSAPGIRALLSRGTNGHANGDVPNPPFRRRFGVAAPAVVPAESTMGALSITANRRAAPLPGVSVRPAPMVGGRADRHQAGVPLSGVPIRTGKVIPN